MEITYSSLKDKEVINIFDGKKLGRIIDLNLDEKGQILSFCLPKEKGFFKNITQEPYIILWCKIIKIGLDTILVDLCDIE